MVEACITLRAREHIKRVFAIKDDINNAYIVLRDKDGKLLDLTSKAPRVKLYTNDKLILDRELEVIDATNGITRLTLDYLSEGVYEAKIEFDEGYKHIEEFLVVIQE